MALVLPGPKAIPISTMMTGCGAAILPAIHYTLTHGIRQPDHEETRFSQMPAFGGVLSGGEIDAVATYVQTLSGKAKPSAQSARWCNLVRK